MDEMHKEEFDEDKDEKDEFDDKEFDGEEEDEDGAEEEDFLYESPYEWHFNHLYDDEFEAIKRAGRLRKRVIYPPHLIDLASNDYLRLAHDRKLFNAADRDDLVTRFFERVDRSDVRISACAAAS
ncbi:hypothetical protein AGMMS50229_14370 [Campylobacterota bacterium]|nr:hypothetical protein AGMMS50229_14370 [Campylobacterota bacterium]